MKHIYSLVLLILTGSLLACNDAQQKFTLPEASAATGSPAAIEVETIRVHKQETSIPLKATGTSRAVREADLAPSMTARIERILVAEGDQVKAGQPLLHLDATTAQLNAAQARASAAAAKAQADQIVSDYRRLAPLAERGSIPNSRIEQLESQKVAALAQVRAAEAAAAAAERVSVNATLQAPFAGRIVSIPVEVGEMASMAPATILMRILDLSSVDVSVRVHERDLDRLAIGNQATATFPSLSKEVQGEVVRIGFEVDSATRTAEVVVRIPNENDALRSGLFTQITIVPSKMRSAIIVPRTALAGSGDRAFCYVLNDGKVARRQVRSAVFDRERFEVVEGLTDGEVLVSRGIERLSDGAKVSVSKEVSP
jgi:RND family efflux transporter MFP subunit